MCHSGDDEGGKSCDVGELPIGCSDSAIMQQPIETLRKVYILTKRGTILEEIIATGDDINDHSKLAQKLAQIFGITVNDIIRINIYAPKINRTKLAGGLISYDWISVYRNYE